MIFLEPSQDKQTTLSRAAPAHLRVATPLETAVYDVVQGTQNAPSVVPQEAQKRVGRHYVDSGEHPNEREQREVDG